MAGQRWQHTFQAGDSFRERQRDAQPAGGTSEQHPCARGTWCYGRTVSTVDSQPVITAALTYRAYCDRCSSHIGECLDALPEAYVRLHGELGEAPRRGQMAHAPFGPRAPAA